MLHPLQIIPRISRYWIAADCSIEFMCPGSCTVHNNVKRWAIVNGVPVNQVPEEKAA